jgi:hypothetical protein
MISGTHWLYAVAMIHKVCVAVVIHRHEFVRLYGDPANPRIYIYKKDAETHYDALPPLPAASDTSAAAMGSVVPDGHDRAASAPLADGARPAASAPLSPPVSQGMVVYGGV